ncbi:PREDICTED: sorting nexin-16 [Ceratosolen solmsi marchali]|uniref:Sorting nexin-16 n=1 Tax=Ceratosolen solmsi marchali TaxID=326594 RepID=A0AAJ6VL92_9HYME|nr:PREDICTED: sorting nexin-16 [Ceratosolen solmsi marchali]
MSSSEASVGCISEVTLAINKTKGSHPVNNIRVLDSPNSTCSGNSNSFTVQHFDYNDDESHNENSEFQETPNMNNLRIPIVGYEVMEERARFTVYKLKVEFKNGNCWFVFRRYTDFVRLFTQLRRQKASVSHLSLPRKKWLGDNFAPSFLEERIRGLQLFVNGLLNSPNLVSLGCVKEFFCLDEPPALSDTVEESRAIFEALEDTIYHLRQQLKERDNALTVETNLCNELRKKLHNVLTESQTCSNCGANSFSNIEI